jgi:penicillin-binding protein 1C
MYLTRCVIDGLRRLRPALLCLATIPVLILTCWLALGLLPAPALYDSQQDSQALFSRSNSLLALSLSQDDKYRLRVPLTEISPELIAATLLYEDQHFYRHPGVNPFSLLRAAWDSLRSPAYPIGGSSISMQLARLRLRLNTRSLSGKLQQIFYALLFERHYRKHELLEAYFTHAPYGANIEGIAAASLIYFRIPAQQLSLRQALTLAVLPQQPSLRWRQAGHASLERARARLAERWQRTQGETALPQDFSYSPAQVPHLAPHFFERAKLLRPRQAFIHSTIEPQLQLQAEQILESHLNRYSSHGITNGAVLIAELPNLEVRAYVGSGAYGKHSIEGFVNGLEAQRSPGSLLKPFVYALALQQGKILPESLLSDLPLRLAGYRPENFERNFMGPISARDALVRSRNIPALEVFRSLDKESLYQTLQLAGLELHDAQHYGSALVLGGLGLSAEQIAQLYAALANHGELKKLRLFEDQPQSASSTALVSKEAAFLTLDMLSSNPPALSRFRDRAIPWKTGTSFGARDAWAAGIVGSHVVVVWLGNFNAASNPNLVGRDFAGPILFSLVEPLAQSKPLLRSSSSAGLALKRVQVCALSGALARAYCPRHKESWFIAGVSPTAPCTVHQQVQVNPNSGLRSCPGEPGEARVYEAWNSQMQDFFTRAGLQRALLPEYAPNCAASNSSHTPLRIISPEQHLEYFLEVDRPLEIELFAAAPADANQLSWFVDQQVVAQIAPGKPAYWSPKSGDYTVRAVDDRGRSSSVRVRVRTRAG